MKDIINIKDVKDIRRLENEYDLQMASLLERKVRLMIKENPHLKSVRNKLRDLIKEYEDRHWSDLAKITDSQVEDSEKAEIIFILEQKFIEKRKAHIRKKLKEFDMALPDLGLILGYSESYMSELINGVSQFKLKDLIIIHRILGLSLNILIPTYLQYETRSKVRETIKKLNKPKLGFKKKELV